jgi:hypothetical protein
MKTQKENGEMLGGKQRASTQAPVMTNTVNKTIGTHNEKEGNNGDTQGEKQNQQTRADNMTDDEDDMSTQH